ncbi:MAG: PEP-CTERM-box response regulator transcription factor [Burkholderiales bacterium]|nr:PEP-CTERM-box response regulator transcription factor [Burkholderiales bacterium]
MSEKPRTLLIVEDDPALQKQMRWALDKYEVVTAEDRESALAQVRRHEPAVATIDLGLPPHPDDSTEGFALLNDILRAAPNTKVIVVTGQGDRSNAVKAIASGAYDFCVKPFEPDVLELIVERAFRLSDLQDEVRRLQSQVSGRGGLVTRDPSMLKVVQTIEKVADTNATVLLLGESGTGKELLARAVHDASERASQRFVAINCAAIPENLLESELFGYERGAFTGAAKQTLGKFEYAHKGTLFLDEIGDLPGALQAKMLRFLQNRVVERLGGREEIPVDVRIVCATHQDLRSLIAQGRFREDLFYRLSEIVLDVPPLRERIGDASLLAHHFVRRFADEHKRGSVSLHPDALDAIEKFPWPGNVRELENRTKRAVIMLEGNVLHASDFGLDVVEAEPELLNLRHVRDHAEKQAVVRAVSRANGNVSKAAEMLGVSRPTLYDLISRHELKFARATTNGDTQEG